MISLKIINLKSYKMWNLQGLSLSNSNCESQFSSLLYLQLSKGVLFGSSFPCEQDTHFQKSLIVC